ncbi:MAG: hypothetical protein IJX91_05015 [Clostridia bacterium]|nr:hypothetical protein [Clostridia bacterium]
MDYTIKNGKLAVTIKSLGAEIVSVVKDGKERSWQNPTGEWGGHAPLLFPVCGRCGVTLDGKQYPIGFHGFAKKTEFSLVKKGEDFISLSICATEATKEVYPFDFVFTITYKLENAKLVVEQTVQNLSTKKPLYFAIGGHDSFALENNLDRYTLVFEKEETVDSLECGEEGRLSGEITSFGKAQTFDLPRDYMQEGVTLILKGVNSRNVTLCEKGGKPLIKVCFDKEFANLLFWREGDAKYICIEPWTNLPDLMGAPDPEFSEKYGVIEVEKGATKKLVRSIEYL